VWPRLQALMDLAIRTSSMATDPHADNVRVESARALLFDLLLHMNARNDVLNDRYACAKKATKMSATHVRAHSPSLSIHTNASCTVRPRLRRRPTRRGCSCCS